MLSPKDLYALVAHATHPGNSSFYRELYGLPQDSSALALHNMEEWRALPILSKDALSAKTLAERTFIPLADLDHIRVSSGTSGKPPLFSPRTRVRKMDYRLRFHDFKKPFLAYTIPLMPHWHERFQKEHGGSPHVLCHDPRHPRASAKLAAAAGADAFSVFVYHVRDLGEEMKVLGTNVNIRFIEVAGELCSRAQIHYMHDTFPNATIVQSYASGEVEDVHIGMPCRPLTPEEPIAHYHPKESHYLEILDKETGALIEPQAGAEGDLLVTSYPEGPASFPLIRYRIGDTIRVLESPCAEHDMWSFTVLGRTDMDFAKIPGGIIRADEIARILNSFPDIVTDNFELHCIERITGQGPRLHLTLHVDIREHTADLETLARDISSHLRVSPDFTYADGVRLGRYGALQCAPFAMNTKIKARRIVWDTDS
jgi:phenylacetate-coenzyme A ligase PaaK-like adenylate-forming protein